MNKNSKLCWVAPCGTFDAVVAKGSLDELAKVASERYGLSGAEVESIAFGLGVVLADGASLEVAS